MMLGDMLGCRFLLHTLIIVSCVQATARFKRLGQSYCVHTRGENPLTEFSQVPMLDCANYCAGDQKCTGFQYGVEGTCVIFVGPLETESSAATDAQNQQQQDGAGGRVSRQVGCYAKVCDTLNKPDQLFCPALPFEICANARVNNYIGSVCPYHCGLCTLEDEDGSNRQFHLKITTTHPKDSPAPDGVPATAASDKINDDSNDTTVVLEDEALLLQQHGQRPGQVEASTSSNAGDRTNRAVLSFAVVVMITTGLFLVMRHRRRARQQRTAQPLENATYETLEANMDSETEYDAENV